MNSPLMTAVVGTSTAAPRPNAPLTPAMAPMMARPTTEAATVRLLVRHMPLHRDSCLETGRDDSLVIVHRTQRDCARSVAVPVQHPHRERVFLAHDGVTRY